MGSLEDISLSPADVRFTPESGHRSSRLPCPLSVPKADSCTAAIVSRRLARVGWRVSFESIESITCLSGSEVAQTLDNLSAYRSRQETAGGSWSFSAGDISVTLYRDLRCLCGLLGGCRACRCGGFFFRGCVGCVACGGCGGCGGSCWIWTPTWGWVYSCWAGSTPAGEASPLASDQIEQTAEATGRGDRSIGGTRTK